MTPKKIEEVPKIKKKEWKEAMLSATCDKCDGYISSKRSYWKEAGTDVIGRNKTVIVKTVIYCEECAKKDGVI